MAAIGDMDRWVQWAEAETGMDFSGGRSSRLREALERMAAPTPGQAAPGLERMLAQPDPAFMERLTSQLTVGETFFFRNEHHFRALREHVVPAILRDNAGQREVRAWSAGCATGEEAYSLAILLDQVLAGQSWQVSILGTDINPEFLDRARQAVYRQWSFRHTSIHQDARYFTPQADAFQLDRRVRDHVRFAYLNLVKDVYPSPLTGTLGLDLVLFRNVAIYLKPEVTRAILERFRYALRPGGWLLIGETELSLAAPAGMEVRRFDQATFFQRKAESHEGGPPSPLPSPAPLPVLAAMAAGTAASLPALALSAPSVPVWAPLPKRKATPAKAAQPPPGSWKMVQHCLARREFAQAEQTLAQVASAQPRAAERLRYAQALLTCAESARARRMLDLALREDPLLLEARLLQASFAEETGDLAAAEQAYRQALYIDRKCLMAHFHLALVQQQRGNGAGAVRSLRTLRELVRGHDPHALVAYGEGICYGRLAELVSLLKAD